MGELLQRVADEQALLTAWSEIRQRAGADGEDRQSLVNFSKIAARSIASVSKELLAGTWAPQPVHPIRIPKPSGGHRTLGIPPVIDRVVERSILQVLDPLIDPLLLPWCFAYRKGLGISDAVRALLEVRDDGATHVVRCDFTNCFDEIPHSRLLAMLKDLIYDADLYEVVRRLVKRHVQGKRPTNKGLHQGSPLSPIFANLYLDEFDRRMLSQGLRVIRYADDCAIPVIDQRDPSDVLELANEIAKSVGMELSTSKSELMSFDEGVHFAGSIATAAASAPSVRFDYPAATTVFITAEGSLIRSRGHRLKIERPNEEDFSISYDRVRQVVVFGRVHFTTPAMQQLLRRGVEVTFLSDSGHYFGRLQGSVSANPFLRSAQYGLAGSRNRQLDIARRIVAGKITNQRSLLLRRARVHDRDLTVHVERLAEFRRKAHASDHLDQLLGFEGAASREYFLGFSRLIGNGFEFHVRRRRPPPDPVNSMLSFGYALLTQEIIGAVESSGLDSCEGVLHRRKIGRPSLALDLVEEFRSMIVDTIVLKLINTGAVKLDDFEYPTVVPEMCRMKPDARRRFLQEYERRMLTMTTHVGSGRRVSYRVAASLQAKDFASELVRGVRSYDPLVWK